MTRTSTKPRRSPSAAALRIEAILPSRVLIEAIVAIEPELVKLGVRIDDELETYRESIRVKVGAVGSIIGDIRTESLGERVRLSAKADPWRLRQRAEGLRKIAAASRKPRGPRWRSHGAHAPARR